MWLIYFVLFGVSFLMGPRALEPEMRRISVIILCFFLGMSSAVWQSDSKMPLWSLDYLWTFLAMLASIAVDLALGYFTSVKVFKVRAD